MRILARRPLTRLELALAVAVLGIAATLLMDRLLAAMEAAERAAMHATLNHTIAAVNARLASATLRGEAGRLEEWLQRDPFELSRTAPHNYAQRSEYGSGTWSYDAVRRELVYQPRLRRQLRTDSADGAIRFRAELRPLYMLVPTSNYEW